MIARQFRNLLLVKDLADERIAPDAIATQLKMHPYVVQKTIPAAMGHA